MPDPAWPESKSAPPDIDVVRRFCNTANHESGADRLRTVGGVRSWASAENLWDGEIDDGDLLRLIDLREHLRAHATAHHDDADTGPLTTQLAPFVAEIRLGLQVHDGQLEHVLHSVGTIDRIVGTVGIAVWNAQRDGRWRRFKACPQCSWVIYDRSRNRSGRWCSMNACGGRTKVAAHRARQRAGDV